MSAQNRFTEKKKKHECRGCRFRPDTVFNTVPEMLLFPIRYEFGEECVGFETTVVPNPQREGEFSTRVEFKKNNMTFDVGR